MQSFPIGPIHLCHVAVLPDAGFAGGGSTSKPISGRYIAISRPNTWAPMAGVYKRQNVVSHSSADFDILDLDFVGIARDTGSCALVVSVGRPASGGGAVSKGPQGLRGMS